ncbi:protein cornichon-like [Bolinopsis microptera]|uniref:protein cornichon-like n=1 Tax=Bolinopsis microptera TaxID=2820187 RepID=UPI00307A5BBF
MSVEIVLSILSLPIAVILMFLVIWNIISFDELKTDYKNPIDLCNSLNPLVLPEYVLQGFIALSYLYYMQYLGIIIMLPLTAYHAYRYVRRPRMSVLGIYDPTAVMNGDEMDRNKKEGFIKLALYLINFFAGLLWMILAVSS